MSCNVVNLNRDIKTARLSTERKAMPPDERPDEPSWHNNVIHMADGALLSFKFLFFFDIILQSTADMESGSDGLGLKRKAVPVTRMVDPVRVTYQSTGTHWQLRAFGRNEQGLLLPVEEEDDDDDNDDNDDFLGLSHFLLIVRTLIFNPDNITIVA